MTSAMLSSLVFRPFTDVRPALRALRSAGVKTAVVSNWDASLESVLIELGLRAELDAVVSSGAFGAAKPDPGIFAEALRRVGAAPDQALHVGDRLDEDVIGARAAGIEPVLLVRDGDGPVRDASGGARDGARVIASLQELVRLIAEPALA
jgi:putative hydrolase of the HAD superfamily